MAKLKFSHALNVSADTALAVLGQVDQYQNFIPGCDRSFIERCGKPEHDVWRGLVRFEARLQKYGVHEDVPIEFEINHGASEVRFWTPESQNDAFDVDARYTIAGEGPEQSLVTLQVDYRTRGKRFLWIVAKPLIQRFFHKFMGLIESRAHAVDLPAPFDLQTGSSGNEPARSVRGFQQLDRSTSQARLKLLSQFSKGSVGAEIGTYLGAFAQLILDQVQPSKLYLIDPWTAVQSQAQAGSWYETVDQDYMDGVFQMVTQRFSRPDVQIVREYSSDALASLQDGELDWIYIDGDHSYEAVRDDLALSFEKVRSGGFISGDDYLIVDNWWKDNVVRAVNEFVATHPVDLIMDEGSQFLLQKR